MWIFLQIGMGTGFAVIMGVVILAVAIYTVIAVRRQAARSKSSERNPALEDLGKRYKMGKMNKKEYLAQKKRLEDISRKRKRDEQ